MTIRICVAGATGWVGEALCPAVASASDLRLVGAVARKAAGRPVPGIPEVAISGSVAEALKTPADVLIDYTRPDIVKDNALTAIAAGVAVVIGTSGLSADDYAELDGAARKKGVGVIAAGNFSLTAALMLRFALTAAEHVPQWEVLDYASFTKPDVPSGTARELAERLSEVRRPKIGVPLEKLHGPKETRGAEIAGTRVHSMRLPSYVLAVEALFGAESERLTIRHDAGTSPAPYVAGTLLAARKVGGVTGLVRGLDRLLFPE
ncbi:MAG: dapB 2 [Rhodospirillales bacterium]|jgi:4-hydroxy-tetrahydrodipicolinate reductase|nr:dapB 2 [Rhodospirillales bacterium]